MKAIHLALIAVPIIAGISVVAYTVQETPQQGEMTSAGLLNDAPPALGSNDARITIVEWGDYQCEYCHRFHKDTFGTIKAEYVDKGTVNVVFRDFVLNGPDSALAAHAAHCAEDQGMFWEYHDSLYENWGGERTGWITDDSLLSLAVSLELDIAEFESCMESDKHVKRIQDSVRYGRSIGVDSTPTFLISNGQDVIKIRGAQPADVFVRAIESL